MCGLVGMIGRRGQAPDLPLLAAMAETLRHRGPDDEGHFVDGPVGLYHKRLAIIDLRSGRQPMTRDGTTLVLNGEIYNYLELRSQLQARGHPFDTTSDTEVVLRLYAERGLDFVRELNGMFAFLLYDRERRRVVAGRDHFGIKPLYVHAGEERILYASEIKALLRHPEVRAALDPEALQSYVTFQFVLGDATLFQGILRVPPGHYQVVDLESGRMQSVRYWDPSFEVDDYHTERYFLDETRRLLEDSLTLQMRSDVPVGTYLSGGIDSSIVTGLAAARSPGRIKAFTGAFREGPEFDETRYAREVAESCGAELFTVHPTEDEFVDLLPRLVYHMDEPAAGPGLFPQYVVSRLAARHVKVALGGQGGDEVFAGYARYVVAYLEEALKGAIHETNDEGEHIVSLRSILPNLPILRGYAPLLRYFWQDGVFDAMDRRYFRLLDRSGGGGPDVFTRDFRASQDREALFARFQAVFNHPQTKSYYNKMTHFDLVASLPGLLQVEDRVSMAVSLESRVPLLDHRVVELVARMPPAMKFRGGEMKYLLKRAASDLLPAGVLERKDKMGFPVPLHLWARGRSREFFRDVLLSAPCRQRGICDTAAVEALIDGSRPFDRRLWGVLNLELWFREFLDRPQSLGSRASAAS